MGATLEPPVDYLRDCSDTSLRYYELSKLEHVANLRRELRVLWEEMLEESALAHLARWMIEHRTELRSKTQVFEPELTALDEPPPVADPAPATPHAGARRRVLLQPAKKASPAQGGGPASTVS